MLTHLLSLLPSGQRLHHLLGTALGAALVLGGSAAQAQTTIYGLGTVSQAIPTSNAFFPGAAVGDQAIVAIDRALSTIGPVATPISGVAAGQRLVGMDYRPNTGELYALGYNATNGEARLYRLNPTTGVSTAVGTGPVTLALGGPTERIGFDFNPTVDRIRVVSSNNANYRLNPNTGGVAAQDGALAYRTAGDANLGKDPLVSAVAYTNSYIGSTSTTLYDIDTRPTVGPGILATQIPPNDGSLNTVGALTLDGSPIDPEAILSVDIFFTGTANEAYVMEVTKPGAAGTSASNLYNLNLTTGAATVRRPIIQAAVAPFTTGAPFDIRDIAIPTPAPTTPNLVGQLVYAVAAGNLISFDSNVPGNIRSAVNFGAGLAAGQTVVGIDYRPANAQMYALGYDASLSANNARIYTVNVSTGALTPVGSGPITLELGGPTERIGFDFNPTVDRIRVVSTNTANYRLNPVDGSITAKDGNLDRTGISAAAYTSNQTANNNGLTVLAYYNSITNTLYKSPNPNTGAMDAVAPSGLSASAEGADLDIYSQPGTVNNTAFLAVAPNGTTTNDRLYNLNLDNGSVLDIGQIGRGTNVTGIAVVIQTATVLTWNGSVSSDWGTAANWTPSVVPTNINDTVIPGGTPNQPTVTTNQITRALTLEAGAQLTLVGTLIVRGNFTNNSGSSATACSGITGPGIFETTGTNAQTFSGTALTCFTNLTVGGATVNLLSNASVQRALVLTGSLQKDANATLTLLSNSTGTAYVVNGQNGLAVVTGIGSPNAPVVVQRYIAPTNPGLGYRHYSAPVANTTVADLAVPGVFAPVVNPAYNTVGNTVTPFPNVFGYEESRVNPTVVSGTPSSSPEFDKGFFSPASTADAMVVTRGYTVNVPAQANVDFVGNLNNGNYNASGLTRGSQAQSGWHLRGNPYPAPLDWNAVGRNGLEDGLYVFKSSGQYTGSYASYINRVGVNGGTNVLPVAQGFFVRTAAGQTGSINFTNAARLTSENAPFERGTADARPQLTLSLAGTSARTQALAYFEPGATAGFDAAFDAHALPAPNGLTLAFETAAAEPLAISGLPALTGADLTLPLRVAARTAGTYALTVDQVRNLPANYRAYLRDALTGTDTELTAATAVNLELAANAAAGGRYAVLFTTQARVLGTAPAALARLASVYPNPARGMATLLVPAALRGTQATAVTVVDNLGRVVLRRTLGAGATETVELPLAGLAPGVYAVLARTAHGLVAKRLVIE
ncbi:DUF4394 domain-containing protein [Hymenobacter arizonensis]|uniref:Por secretion system C-terminal sorting domain-containing protein n=1 Tax=Hymenobacter arizonensis TaxID=1227077 RepID=A0A1I5Z2R9_HYMAR|nr:DUF4394 domain-containing protein [Hymenobacter arizonensis]SFQ50730.1 Por secretion system C-terminal sorting domain-containing protein [Hymenobacter arizonensis]